MAPSAPSLTSQARAAELNAATAARARTMQGKLADIRELPSSQPVSLADFTTYTRMKGHRQNTHLERVENRDHLQRPLRPVDRYHPSVTHPEPSHPYPAQPASTLVYSPASFPVPAYYFPVYQGVPGYPPMYPSQTNVVATVPVSSSPGASPQRGSPYPPQPTCEPPGGSHPLSGHPAMHLQSYSASSRPVSRPDTPLFVATAGIPRKDSTSEKKSTSNPIPCKAVEEPTQTMFGPQDLSPSKYEVDLVRYKIEAAVSSTSDSQSQDAIPPNDNSEESGTQPPEIFQDFIQQKQDLMLDQGLGKTTSGPETLDDEQNSGETTFQGNSKTASHSAQLIHGSQKIMLEHAFPCKMLRKSPQRNQLLVQAQLRSAQQLLEKNNVPWTKHTLTKLLTYEKQSKSSFQEDKSRHQATSDSTKQVSATEKKLSLGNESSLKVNMSKEDQTWLFSLPSGSDGLQASLTSLSEPRRLQSPFQHRDCPPVKFYEPIVNKYLKNVFESEYTRWKAVRSISKGSTWREFQRDPKVEGVPGPFKGFPDLSANVKSGSSSKRNDPMVPPPGLAASKLISGDTNYGIFYDRVLSAEDWFHQCISKR